MRKARILVTGAVGRVGSAVVRQCIERGHTVRAVAAHPDGEPAQRLARLGAEVFHGRGDALEDAAEGMPTAFLVTDGTDTGPQQERRDGLAAVAALQAAGVQHIIHASVAGADQDTGIPHFETQWAIEQAVRASGADATVVAPVFFRENLTSPLWRDGLNQGTLAMAMPPDRPLQNVEIEEVARFVARIVEEPEPYVGRRIEVASDATTPARMARTLGRAIGQPVRFREIPLQDLASQDPAFAKMFAWFASAGHEVDVRGLAREEPEVEWRTFTAWARAQPWHRLLDARI